MTDIKLSTQQMDDLEKEIRSDPVKWAYWKLKDPKGNPWKARWYQKKMIDGIMGGDRRIAARMGRRVGKTETMIIYCLWYAFHHRNSRLLIITPYEHQVRLIFMRLAELVRDCDELQDSVHMTKNPFIASFGNGSSIMGFTGGATSGSQSGASVRGQRADFLFLDEIDYMSVEGIDAVTAIANEDPRRIGIWVSSTPTGKRGFFYNVCTNPDTGYKAYHFPSHVNPDFDEKMEGELRATMTTQGYIHEVEAEFGEETVGVFNKNAVERAKDQYLYAYRELNLWEQEQFKKSGYDLSKIVYTPEYTVDNPAPRALRVVGVDWDKFGASTQIVVSEFDEVMKKFRAAKRYEIARGDFTFDNAVNKLIEINEIWDPEFLYMDAGSGEYQIEVLRKYGKNNPHTRLDKKIRRIQFAQVFEIIDPVTKEIDRKDAKNFMVNQTSILLERDQILLSPFDEMIWKQMMDYQVIRITQTGKPIYTSENEHALDAFMLTILGFTIEFPNIAKILEEVHYAKTSFALKSDAERDIRKKLFDSERDIFDSPNKKKRIVEPKDNQNWHMEKVALGYKKSSRVGGGSFGRNKATGNSFSRSSF